MPSRILLSRLLDFLPGRLFLLGAWGTAEGAEV
jgi:hypothetical protein